MVICMHMCVFLGGQADFKSHYVLRIMISPLNNILKDWVCDQRGVHAESSQFIIMNYVQHQLCIRYYNNHVCLSVCLSV